MGKLGAATADPTAVMADLGVLDAVNGPEDLPDWDAIAWRRQEEQVRRLRQRIFKAAQAEDWKQVRNLQKLTAQLQQNNTLVMRRVTQRNTGRHTPGVDGQVVALDPGLGRSGWCCQTVTADLAGAPCGGYIPKKGETPTRIPVSPTGPSNNGSVTRWNRREARLDPKQYDWSVRRRDRDDPPRRRTPSEWVLDADLKSVRPDHHNFLGRIGTFLPEQIRAR
jgi:RNA-directed DNA polymerase